MELVTAIPQNEEGLTIVLSAILDVTENRMLWAIYKTRLTPLEIDKFNVYMLERQLMLDKERVKFHEESQHFIETYVLENNQCVRDAGMIFHNIHHSMVGARNVLTRFNSLKHKRSELYRNVDTPSLYDKSYLSVQMPMSEDLFGMESYPDGMKTLCNRVVNYFKSLYQLLSECISLLKDEKYVKNNPALVQSIYDNFAAMVVRSFEDNMDVLGVSPDTLRNILNPLAEKRKTFSTEIDFLQDTYHNSKPNLVRIYILYKMYCCKANKNMTEEEIALFGDDEVKVGRIRYAIAHFCNLCRQQAKGKLKKVDADSLACFAAWCGVMNDKAHITTFYTYFEKEFSKAETEVKLTGVNSVYRSARYLENETMDRFNKKINCEIALAEQENRLVTANRVS